jgi:hypothetical protein
MTRPLHAIAYEIASDWQKPYFGAKPYIGAMLTLSSAMEMYGADSARSIIRYFLANAQTWRGPVAKRVKAELRAMVK